MLNRSIRDTQDFLLSNYFSDGIRITLGVLLPSVILAQFGLLQYGMTISLGALCVSVVDFPGPLLHRRNAMSITVILMTLTSLIVGLVNANNALTALLLVVFCIIFSMFAVYGAREASIGTASLLVLVLSIDDVRPADQVILHAGMVLAGGVWYTLLSYFANTIRPYRIVEQTLSDSVLAVSEFLEAKAKFYNDKTNLEANYANLLKLQVKVNEQQEAVREVLFKTREIVRDSTPQGRFLLLVFVDMVDVFEQVMSSFYNYEQLHEQFGSTGILLKYEQAILKIADQFKEVAFALKTGGVPNDPHEINEIIKSLRAEISFLEANNSGEFKTLGIVALKNIEVNIENIVSRVSIINKYFNKTEKKHLQQPAIETEKFISRQSFDVKLLLDNFSLRSSNFRHSLRVAIVMLTGFLISRSLSFSHSYWILLTILVISKPAFSLTKERNYQRLIGTIVGAIIGVLILTFIVDKNVLFVILLICMVGCYSFQRKNYVVSVLFMTPYILVLFNFLGMGGLSIAQERIYDTLIGSAIAFAASYFLFPTWEYVNVKDAMIKMLRANKNYFEKVTALYVQSEDSITDYKLARKEVYVSTANLSTLFQRMFSEPKSKQIIIKELYEFTALNHLLSSNIATLTHNYKANPWTSDDLAPFKAIIDNTSYLIKKSQEILVNNSGETSSVPLVTMKTDSTVAGVAGKELMYQQFSNIQKVSYYIYKLTEHIKVT
ncbi:MAG: hypothetical protein JWQ28_620 [Pedobacter sp.]|nr:hypothetical protein [Pedobacter sp.]